MVSLQFNPSCNPLYLKISAFVEVQARILLQISSIVGYLSKGSNPTPEPPHSDSRLDELNSPMNDHKVRVASIEHCDWKLDCIPLLFLLI